MFCATFVVIVTLLCVQCACVFPSSAHISFCLFVCVCIESVQKQCVRTMYANENVGVPVDDNTLSVSNTAMSYSGGVLTMTFTRPMNSGHNPIGPDAPNPFQQPLLMWGLGPAPNLCTDAPNYHGFNRGVHPVSYLNPTGFFPPVQQCH